MEIIQSRDEINARKENWIEYLPSGGMTFDNFGFTIFMMDFFLQHRFVDFGLWERGGMIEIVSSAGKHRITLEIKGENGTRILELGEISVRQLSEENYVIHIHKFVQDSRLTARLTEFEQAVNAIMEQAKQKAKLANIAPPKQEPPARAGEKQGASRDREAKGEPKRPGSGAPREEWYRYKSECDKSGSIRFTHRQLGQELNITEGTARNYYAEWSAENKLEDDTN